MYKIDSSYDVILTYSPIIEITGHIFECFDYFLFLRKYFKVGILFFCGLSKCKLKIAWESKYNVPFSEVEDNLIQLDISNNNSVKLISFGKKTFVLLADGNIKSLEYSNIILATKHLYGFMCEYHDTYKDVKLHNHITYLQDFRVHKKTKYVQSLHYVKKLPFKYYKTSISPNENIGMIYMTYVCRKISPELVAEYHKMSKCTTTLLIVPYKLHEYDNIQHVKQIEAPVYDLFDKFDTYIYTPVSRKFDCSPRLITECFFHNKKIFKQLDYYDIGLETRYSDCISGIEHLDLTNNDDILHIINTELHK